jgi:hypothetical protein
MSNRLHLMPLTAHELAVRFIEIAKNLSSNRNIELTISTPFNWSLGISSPPNTWDREAAIEPFLAETNKLPRVFASGGYIRSNDPPEKFTLKYEVNEAGQASLVITDVGTADAGKRLASLVYEKFDVQSFTGLVGASLPAAQREAIRFNSEVVERFAVQVAELGRLLTTAAASYAEDFRKLSADLEEKHQQKMADLEAAEHQKRKELEAAKQQFEEAKKTFDDRDRIHVRRDLMKLMNDNVKERSSIRSSSTAGWARILVHFTTWAILILSGSAAVYAGSTLIRADTAGDQVWRAVPILSSTSLLFVGTIIFYFRWISRWSDVLAVRDFNNDQYASDILRANWVAEYLMEYTKDHPDREVPPDVIASFTQSLFKAEASTPQKYHPADDILSGLGRVRKLTVNKDGLEIEKK